MIILLDIWPTMKWPKIDTKQGHNDKKAGGFWKMPAVVKGPGTRNASHSHLHCISFSSGAASIVNININSCSALKSVCEKTIWNEFNFGELHRKHSIQYYILYNIFALTFSSFLSFSTVTNLGSARGKLNVFRSDRISSFYIVTKLVGGSPFCETDKF